MKIVIFSSPEKIKGEASILNEMLQEQITFHLRKPNWAEKEINQLIEQIDPLYHSKIVLHGSRHLLNRYNLKGIHLTRELLEKAIAQKVISRTVHDLQDLKQDLSKFQYVFLSPVYPSISKPGYTSSFNVGHIETSLKHVNTKVIALGGIRPDYFSEIEGVGFHGMALLGHIWQSHQPIQALKEVVRKVT